MRGTGRPPKLPEGYRLDLSSDPDAPALRRPDGALVARFVAGGMTYEVIEQEALEDLLRRNREPRGTKPSRTEDPRVAAPYLTSERTTENAPSRTLDE